jgi:cation transporter-like permease
MMADQRDTVLIEQAKIERMRLGSALLHGHIDERRTINDHTKRLVGSLIVAAVVCAVCAGISFVSQIFADRAETTPTSSVLLLEPADLVGAAGSLVLSELS